MITAQIVRQYHFLIPRVYRYMDNKYIDDFFNTESLDYHHLGFTKNMRIQKKGTKVRDGT